MKESLKMCDFARVFITAIAISIGFSLAHAAKPNGTLWRAQMNGMSEALQDVLPDLFNPALSFSPEYKAKVKKIYDLSRTVDILGHTKMAPDPDPVLPYIAKALKSDLATAYENLTPTNVRFSKDVLRSSISYCVACHTKSNEGSQFPLLTAFEKPMQQMRWVDKINVLVATRQFDSALDLAKTQLGTQEDPPIPSLDVEKAVRAALTVAVRVKADAEIAADLCRRTLLSPAVPENFKETVNVWMSDINSWKNETSKKAIDKATLLKMARGLTSSAGKESEIPANSEVRYLRASNLMQQVLSLKPSSHESAEALYTIGRTYELLQDLGLWTLHEIYFEACINTAPQTQLSLKCFKRYEEAVMGGYTGSSGVHLPVAVERHIKELRTKSQINKSIKSGGIQ
jgi:hypothetical protein